MKIQLTILFHNLNIEQIFSDEKKLALHIN